MKDSWIPISASSFERGGHTLWHPNAASAMSRIAVSLDLYESPQEKTRRCRYCGSTYASDKHRCSDGCGAPLP